MPERKPKPKPKKMGRPKLPKGESKDKLVALRLSPDTHKRVSVAAKAKGTNVSDWIRSILETNLNGEADMIADDIQLGSYIAESGGLNRAGSGGQG